MILYTSFIETLVHACEILEREGIDYRVTGVLASNIYGRGLATNVMDIAVESDDAVRKAVEVLRLPSATFSGYDPYVYRFDEREGFIRIQGDILGEPFIYEDIPFKVHNKKLLLDRLDVYGAMDGRVAEQAAFIALTLDDEKIGAYKDTWNRM